MSEAQVVRVDGLTRPDSGPVALDFTLSCARPSCRREFKQSTGRGRRRSFCSDLCRRKADTEYRQAKARLANYEELSRKERHLVLAFGRADEQDDDTPVQVAALSDEAALKVAATALGRAEAILPFLIGRDPQVVVELQALIDGIAPLVHQLQAG